MIEEKYKLMCATPSDINEHLPTLRKYASECDSIVELGVRYIVSTWALLAGSPKTMLSVDIKHPKEYGGDIQEVYQAAEDADIAYIFAEASSLDILLPEHDLLFIDTNHTYEQLSAELKQHSILTKKYILMHDTSANDFPQMRKAINEFLEYNAEWKCEKQYENNNGLTVLTRIKKIVL